MSDEWWNLDQAVAWVMARDERVVSKLKNGGLTAFILYPMDLPFCFQRTEGNSEDAQKENNQKRMDFWKNFGRGDSTHLIEALKKGAIIAKGFENGKGVYAVTIEPEWWEDLEIESLDRSSIAKNKHGNGAFWSEVRIKRAEIMKVFKGHPQHVNFSAPASKKIHEEVYRRYNAEQIDRYIKGDIKKPWQAQDKEEPFISLKMGPGFDRKIFREVRKEVLAQYPYSQKTNLSKKNHDDLRAFISKRQ